MLNATILSAYRYGKRELQRAPTSPLFRITRRVHAVFLDESAGEYSVCLKMKGGQGPSMLMPQLLLEVWARIRNTIVLITHDIDEALFLVDRILVMSPRPGRIIDEITRDFARPRGHAAWPAVDLQIDEVRPVGHYAVQLVFSDRHARVRLVFLSW